MTAADSPRNAPLARPPQRWLCRDTDRPSSQIPPPLLRGSFSSSSLNSKQHFTLFLSDSSCKRASDSSCMFRGFGGTTSSCHLLSTAAQMDLSCVSVGVFSLHLHVPEGQTLGRAAAQHLGLELQLLRVSILKLLMQQPAQQKPDSVTTRTAAPASLRLCVFTSSPGQCCLAWRAAASPGSSHVGSVADSSGKA